MLVLRMTRYYGLIVCRVGGRRGLILGLVIWDPCLLYGLYKGIVVLDNNDEILISLEHH
jgi:hypothetical protein